MPEGGGAPPAPPPPPPPGMLPGSPTMAPPQQPMGPRHRAAARAAARPGMPRQQDIDTAAAVMEKALEIVVDDEASHEAVKAAVGTCCCRARGSAASAGSRC